MDLRTALECVAFPAELARELQAQLAEADEHRPNTTVPRAFFDGQQKIILCTGEQKYVLLDAIKRLCPGQLPWLHHESRGYYFWRFPGFTLILSPIGTGALEPMFPEILRIAPDLLRQLVHIGTAGTCYKQSDLGSVVGVGKAVEAGCATHQRPKVPPLGYHFPSLSEILPWLRLIMEISTDFYWATQRSPKDPHIREFQKHVWGLRSQIKRLWKRGRIVSMEAYQVYLLCSIYGGDTLEYITLRGLSNQVGDHVAQNGYSTPLLCQLLMAAFSLLSIECAPLPQKLVPTA